MNHENLTNNFCDALRDRALETEPKNQLGAAYLACVCGMYAHSFHLKINPFRENSTFLYSWWDSGFGASKQAMSMNEVLQKRFTDFEKAMDASKKKS